MFWIPTNLDKKSSKQNQGKTLDILVHIEGDEKKHLPPSFISDNSRPQMATWNHDTPVSNGNASNFKVVDMTPVRNNRTRPSTESSIGKSILIPELKKDDNSTREQGRIGLRKKYSRTQSSVDDLDFSDVDSIDNDASSVSSHQSHELFRPMQITIGKKDGILMLKTEDDEISLSDASSSFHIDYMDDSVGNSIDEMKEYDHDGDSRDDFDDDNNRIQHRKKDISTTSFELESTKHQNHKDDKQKKYHQIRIACLEVAIDSYKKAKVEVPDVSTCALCIVLYQCDRMISQPIS